MLRTAVLIIATLAAAAAGAQALDGRLKKIADSKSISVAYRADATPFAFVDDKNQPVGFSIDLCKRVVNSIERQINVQGLQIKWVPVTVQTRFDAVASGQADMECGSSTVTLARMKQVDFSSYIFVETTSLLVTTTSGLRSMSDMAGKKIGVIGGTTNERAINMQLKRRQLNTSVVAFKSREEVMAALEDGKVDAFASDRLLLLGAGSKAKNPRGLLLLPDELSFEPYAIALPRGDASMRLAVNTGLAQIYSTGEIADIFGTWFASLGKPPAIFEAIYLMGSIPE